VNGSSELLLASKKLFSVWKEELSSVLEELPEFLTLSERVKTAEFLIKRGTMRFKAVLAEDGDEADADAVNGANSLVSVDGEAKSIVDRLFTAASELDLELTSPKESDGRKLSVRIISALSELYPSEFAAFHTFAERSKDTPLITEVIAEIVGLADELNLYAEVAALFARVSEQHGLPRCIPVISDVPMLTAKGLHDLSLTTKTKAGGIVANDAWFTSKEPFFYLVGANGGGKTTYLRSLGSSALLARAGFPVAAERCKMSMFDNIYTHFPRDEHGESRLADEKTRMATILDALSGGSSLVLLNETFSTTGEALAGELTNNLAKQLSESGSLTLYITHQHSSAQMFAEAEADLQSVGNSKGGKALPVLTAQVNATEEHARTFQISRAANLGGSFADDILRRYGLDAESLSNLLVNSN
jgi:ABC-type branched-subunit amino acid transport system ATPase component